MMVRLTNFDAAEHLPDDDARSCFLSEALATGDPAYAAHALGVVFRSRGVTDVARTVSSKKFVLRSL